MKLEKMNKNERSLLLFLETCAVERRTCPNGSWGDVAEYEVER